MLPRTGGAIRKLGDCVAAMRILSLMGGGQPGCKLQLHTGAAELHHGNHCQVRDAPANSLSRAVCQHCMEAPTGILSVGIPGLPPLATIPLAGPHPLCKTMFTYVFLTIWVPSLSRYVSICMYILSCISILGSMCMCVRMHMPVMAWCPWGGASQGASCSCVLGQPSGTTGIIAKFGMPRPTP